MTTETTTQPEAPKKSNKKTIVLSALVVLLLVTNHFTCRNGYTALGIDVKNDSTIVIAPVVDTTQVVATPTTVIAPVDTTKKDTTKTK